MCHGQMITLPRREPNGASCDVCRRTAPATEKVTVLRAKVKGEVHTLVVCKDHNLTEVKLKWKASGWTSC